MSEERARSSIPLDDCAAFISKSEIRLFSLNAADHYRTHCPHCDVELVQLSSDMPTLTCKQCSRRYLVTARGSSSSAQHLCADPQFELCAAPDDEFFEDDSALSIGNPGLIDVEGSDGVHRTFSGGTSAHESIILRTRSSVPFCAGEALPAADAIDDALMSKFLLKATSSCIKAGLAAQPAAPPPDAAACAAEADPDVAHAEEVLQYLRSFATNEDCDVIPFLHSPSKPMPIDSVRAIIRRAQDLFAQEPRVLLVPDDVRVLSDIHGNFKDLLIWQRLFWPDGAAALQGSVLWLGDYVDRGLNSVEVLLYMLAQKVKNPSKWLMLRGNHEARLMNGWVEQYKEGSFQTLCSKVEHDAGLMPKELWFEFNAVFDYLPLAAVIQGSIFAVHGGLPRRSTWDHLCSAPRDEHDTGTPARPPIEALLETLPRPWNGENPRDASNMACTAGYDMLWADPVQGWVDHRFSDHIPNGELVSGGSHAEIFDRSVASTGWRACKPRIFGFANAALDHFLGCNNYVGIIRGHMGKQSGVQLAKCGRVLTVFSTSSDHHQSRWKLNCMPRALRSHVVSCLALQGAGRLREHLGRNRKNDRFDSILVCRLQRR